MATQLNCCCICMGGARLRQAFGLSLNKAKCFWIECDCGLRTPMCDSQEDAINFWNWLNRETKANALKSSAKAKWLEKVEEDNAKILKEKQEKLKSLQKATKENGELTKKKRHRRTKAEMEEARKAAALVTEPVKKKRHRRTKAEMEEARKLLKPSAKVRHQ